MRKFSRFFCGLMVILMIFTMITPVGATEAPFAVKDLKVNSQVEPINVMDEILFSWRMESDKRDMVQSAYQLKVGTAEGAADLWDSGKVDSFVSAQVPYAGAPLSSMTKYYWSVTVWDGEGHQQTASSFFETALFAEDWQADMITNGAAAKTIDKDNYTVEADVKVKNHGAGIIIGGTDAKNFVCAQINTKSSSAVTLNTLTFVNNKHQTGLMASVNITSTLSHSAAASGFHFKAVVTKGGKMTFYINGTQVLQHTVSYCTLGGIGIRQWLSTQDNEQAYIDNLKVTDGNGNVMADYDFSTDTPLAGTVENGWLYVANQMPSFYTVDQLSTIRPYTIEADFTVDKGAVGFAFAVENRKNFLFWQVNIARGASSQKVVLAPHTCINEKNTNLGSVDLSALIPWDRRNEQHSIRIEVGATKVVKTYINGQLVDTRSVPQACFAGVGFRQNYNDEAARIDSYKLSDGKTGEALIECDYESHEDPFSVGRTENGMLVLDSVGIIYREIEGGMPLFRKEFTTLAGKKVASARLYATALGVYEAYIDGKKAGDEVLAPGASSYSKLLKYQCYDVTDSITEGTHTLGAAVGNGWYASHLGWGNNSAETWGSELGLMAQLEITYTDGTRQSVVTDDSWTSSTDSPYIITDNQNGETYDATKEQAGWNQNGFDDSKWEETHAFSADTDTHVDMSKVELTASQSKVVCAQQITPVSITKMGDKFIVDFGQNFAGVVSLDMTGKAGQTVRLRYAEVLEKDGSVHTKNLRTALATDYYTFKDDQPVTWMPVFTYHGFRYVEVAGVEELTAENVTGIVQTEQMTYGGNIQTDNDLINQIYHNTLWSQYSNFYSIPTDCPQRDERRGWTGDAHMFFKTATYNADTYNFMVSFLEQMRLTQNTNGCVATYAPNNSSLVGNAASAGWGDAAVILPWYLYTEYGSRDVLNEYYDMMVGWTNYQISQTTFATDGKYILPTCTYGDWLSIGETSPKDVVATQFLIYTLSLMEKTATVLNKTADAEKYAALTEAAKEDFIETYVSDGRITGDTQTTYVLALRFDIDPSNTQNFADRLAEKIVANGNHLTCGFMGLSYLCPMLTEHGYKELAYTLVLQNTFPSWGYSIANGATTIWEAWDACVDGVIANPASASFNHYSYGSVVEWMYKYMGGISSDEADPGYHHILLDATMDARIGNAALTTQSTYGEISSIWSKKDCGSYVWSVSIPANSYATLRLDQNENILLDGEGLTTGNGVRSVTEQDGSLYVELGSGNYTFSCGTHVEGELIEDIPATDTADGTAHTECTLCGEKVKDIVLPATGEAAIGDTVYATLEEALSAATEGQTVTLRKNVIVDYITVDPSVTLDLCGNTLTAGYVIGFKGSAVIDGSEDNSGKLIVDKNKVALDQTNGGYLPVYEDNGYIFTTVKLAKRSEFVTKTQFAFSPVFETFSHEALMEGHEKSNVNILIRLTWEVEGNYRAVQDFTYLDERVHKVIKSYDASEANYGLAFAANFEGSEAGKAQNVQVTAVVVSDTGVEIAGASIALPEA